MAYYRTSLDHKRYWSDRKHVASVNHIKTTFIMVKNTNLCVDLKTVLQQDALLTKGLPYNGVLTRDSDDHYLFEEAVRHNRHGRRNPKLFDGNYCSLVHMQNGRYQIHMKTIDASSISDSQSLAFKVYSELLNAFAIIDNGI